MRIDSLTNIPAWLTGLFSGSFRGNLEGTASFAETASHALEAVTASHALEAVSASYAKEATTASYALEAGSASYAKEATTASYTLTSSTVEEAGFIAALSESLEDPENCSIFEKIRATGRLFVKTGIRIPSGSIETDTGSVRIGKVALEYLEDEDALVFSFLSDEEIPPFPPDPWPPCPPCPPPCPEPTEPKYDHSIDYARSGPYKI